MNYRADYEKNKLNYTLPQDVPQLVKAKTNAKLFSEVREQCGEKVEGLWSDVKNEDTGMVQQVGSVYP